jgi:hypothetical protein
MDKENLLPNETHDLLQALLIADEAISKSRGHVRQRIVTAYNEAQIFAAKQGKPTMRAKACFAQYKIYKNADDVAAIGWLLVAARERIAEKNLIGWQLLKSIAERSEKTLTQLQGPLH